LLTILLNTSLFGLVSQQVYGYFRRGFKDPIYLKLFVVVEFILVGAQCLIMWHFVYRLLIIWALFPPTNPLILWEGPINSILQLIIIIFSNVFLAIRIDALTKSHLQSGLVVFLSTIAFIGGMINITSSWRRHCTPEEDWISSVVCHTVQAVAESFITLFLVRELLKNRNGIRRSDTLINYLVRTTIQTGGLATAWAIGGLVTWFFLPRVQVFRIFDITSGSIYVHAVFETLLARVKLREQMLGTSVDQGQTAQDGPKQSSRVPERPHSLSVLRVQNSVAISLDTSEPRPDYISKSDATLPGGKLEFSNEL